MDPNQPPHTLNLYEVSSDQLYDILDEIETADCIPSGSESDIDDADGEEEQVVEVADDIAFDSWDSEDDLPLSAFITTNNIQLANVVSWGIHYISSLKTLSDFQSKSGLADEVEAIADIDCTPYKLFNLLITDEILDSITFQTNIYAEQQHQVTKKRYTQTTITEIKTFIGLNLLMGIKRSPSYRDYWCVDQDLHDPYISQFMPVNRFSWLLSHLHLNDNSIMPGRNDDNHDKLYKVRPFISALKTNFKKCLNPHRCIAIDESMIKFKGRSSIKQYLPKKPIKRGYKVWALADSEGYLYDFEIYTGKTKDYVEKGLGEKVVLRLMEGLEYKEHCLYFDNYFNTYNLLKELKDKGINACGTVMANRKNLPTLKHDKNLKQGEYDYNVSGDGISMVKWKDKRTVHLLSNFHDPQSVAEVKRKDKDGSSKQIPCPSVLVDYNKNMNCVDRFDQLKSTYEIDRKSKKWWMRIFWHFIDCCIVNSYILYKLKKLPFISLKDFRRRVIDGLLAEKLVELRRKEESAGEPIQKKSRNVPPEVRFTSSSHQPIRSTRRRCALCSTKDRAVRSDWACTICEVALCLGKAKDCFQKYHRGNHN